MKTVTVRIKKDGSGDTEFSMNGFVGNECDIIREIERRTGEVKETELTVEAYNDGDQDLPVYT